MKRLLLFLLLPFFATAAFGTDAYFLEFSGQGRGYPSGAPVIWSSDILFYNGGSSSATIRLLGVSNGAMQQSPLPLTLSPNETRFLSEDTLAGPTWVPTPRPAIWVLHLDIPPGVVAESRDQMSVGTGIPEPGLGAISRGKVSMPIFRELTPAGTPQVHLGTDLGGYDSRINVMIYNAGTDTAVATINVRRTCDQSVQDSRTITIPPNTVLQTNGLAAGASSGCPEPVIKRWEGRYTVVTVNQPSLSFPSNINENVQPSPADIGVIPTVGLGMTNTQRF